MEVLKAHELWVFWVCFLSGMVLGCLFDFFRALRKSFRVSDGLVALQDMLFWLAACIIVYGAVQISNDAELRWFELVALVSGALVYLSFLSEKLISFFCAVIRFTAAFLRFTARPFVFLVSLLKRGLCSLNRGRKCLEARFLYNLHKLFLKTSHKTRVSRENICKKFFFTFLKR